MKIYFVPPGEGLPLTAGRLMTEDGDFLEGHIIDAAWDGTGYQAGAPLNPVVLRLTIMAEAFIPASDEKVEQAKQSLQSLLKG